MPVKRFAIMLTISGLTLGVGACGGNADDKAGGAVRSAPVVLQLADFGDEELAKVYADEVVRRSRGSLRIEIHRGWRHGEVNLEEGLIGDVKAGKADIGWTATRGFDEVGVTSFDALHAPLLVDSLALEEKVLRSPLVREMLKGLEPLGVVGLGILPGPLRRPLGLTRSLVRPSDYRSRRFGLVRSRVGAATMRTLGATPRTVPLGTPIGEFGLDGLESNLSVIEGNDFGHGAKGVTSNVALWARPEVLLINRQAYGRLTGPQRQMLRDAAAAAVAPALATLRAQDASATKALCARGLRFTVASAADVAALRNAVRPVYSTLDARTNDFVGRIREMARDVTAEPPPTCGTQTPPTIPSGRAKTPLDGTYRMHIRREDARDPGGAPPLDENYGDFRYVLDRGRFDMTQKGGRSDRFTRGVYSVEGDRLTLTVQQSGGVIPNSADEKPGEVFAYKWSLYRDRLSLRPVHPEPGGYPPLLWTRTGDVR
jgi:TRAP-type C4-dicarboxylate transport system substrate-binding protein